MAEITGAPFEVVLPVTLDEKVRRQLLLQTGVRPDKVQEVTIDDLTALPTKYAEELLDVLDQVGFATTHQPAEEDLPPGTVLSTPRRIAVKYDRVSVSRDDAGEPHLSVRLGEEHDFANMFDEESLWFAGEDGWSRNLLDHALRVIDREGLHAALAGAPLVDDLFENLELTPEVAIGAYRIALTVMEDVVRLATTGQRVEHFSAWDSNPDLVVLHPTQSGPGKRAVGFVRAANAELFDRVRELVETMEGSPVQLEWLRATLKNASRHGELNAMSAALDQAKEALERRRTYDTEAAEWIRAHGSKRLETAVERGYKHDGIYRDERLAAELPDFVGTKGKVKVRELVNPSAEALDLESATLALVKDKPGMKVRLVYVTNYESPLHPGEAVEVTGFLGRHTVFRPVVDPADDIPF